METIMGSRIRLHITLLLASVLSACTLPGAATPTPFSYPTPNLTHTAIFAATELPPAEPPTLAPLEPTTELPPDTPATETPSVPGDTAVPTSPTSIPTATSAELNQRPNGSPVTAAFLTTAVTIDGDLSDWTTTPYTANETAPLAGDNWTGTNDLSATFHIAWDANYLYVAVQRTDDTFVQISWGRYMYRGDDVEIQLDTDLAGDYYTTSMSHDDYQIGLSPGNFGSLSPEVYRWFPRSLESWLTTADVAAQKSNGGYNLEGRIPWSAFNVTPTGGSHYGFALSLSDNDLVGSSIWQSMVSNVNTRRTVDPTTWGTLILQSP